MLLWLEDRNGGRQSGPHIGWRYEPGTLRRDPYYPARCRDLDPRFNCHGYQFAEARLWLEKAAVDQILEYWCRPVSSPGDLRDGDVRIFSSLKVDVLDIPPGLGWFTVEPDHSQILQQAPTVVDDKLGVLRYDPAFSKDPGWTGGGVPKHYRCRF